MSDSSDQNRSENHSHIKYDSSDVVKDNNDLNQSVDLSDVISDQKDLINLNTRKQADNKLTQCENEDAVQSSHEHKRDVPTIQSDLSDISQTSSNDLANQAAESNDKSAIDENSKYDINFDDIDEGINYDFNQQDPNENHSANDQLYGSSSQDVDTHLPESKDANLSQFTHDLNRDEIEEINDEQRSKRDQGVLNDAIDIQFTNQLNKLSIEQPNRFIDQLAGELNQTKFLKKQQDRNGSKTQDNELVDKLKTELDRLKRHLIQIEEDYTNELVEVQQREQTLKQQLLEARAEIEQLDRRLNNTGPLVAIRQQAEQALDERDQVLQRCSKLEDEVQRSQASVANLQLVIERMQKDHNQRIQTANKLHEQSLLEERCRHSQSKNEINQYQLKLKESNNALQAAARLSQQLHAKQETIDQLRTHLQKKEELVGRLHDEIDNLNASCEGKMDKQFLKNLVLGYFSAASDTRQDVARLLARCLDFNEQEMRKAGIHIGTSTHDHSHRRQTSTSSTASFTTQDESIAQQFVQFLEDESIVQKATITKQLAHDLTRVISTPDQIKATNLISKTSTTSSCATTNQPTYSADVAATGQQEVKPMLIPNSAIMNAQLSKMPFNTNGNQTSNTASNETIKPIVLNFPNTLEQ